MASLDSYLSKNPIPTAPQAQPNFVQRNIFTPISNAFQSGIKQVGDAISRSQQGANPLSTGAEAGAGIVNAAFSPLAPITKPLSEGINNTVIQPIANAVSDNPSVQNFAMSKTGQEVAQGAQDVGNLSTIAGGAAAGTEIPETLGNMWDTAKGLVNNSKLDTATAARESAATTGVAAANEMTDKVSQFQSNLGTNFRQGAQNIETANPNANLTLSHDQLMSLNALKENKSFALPDYLKPSFTPENLSDIEKGGALSPTQTQDLITQLNKSTFRESANGLQVDQGRIAVTNDIKQSASQAFGKPWDDIYKEYSQGVNAFKQISDIVNTDKAATASDMNQSLGNVLKLSKTPEGKIFLKNAIDEFKQHSGIDLTNPTESISKILDSQEALEEAQKPGFLKQMFNPNMVGRLASRVVMYATLGTWLRNIIKNL